MKRGQVTVYIIIGLLILLAFFLVFSLMQAQLGQKEILQPEAIPIKIYTDSCLSNIAKDAITILGTRGGYINLPADMQLDLQSTLFPYPSIRTVPQHRNPSRIPFWYYTGFDHSPETRGSMAREISQYVEQNIIGCLDDFSPFTQQFTITTESPPTATTTIGDDEVTVQLNYVVEAEQQLSDRKTVLPSFEAKVPVKLGKIFDLAKKIMNEENDNQYFENITIDLMALNPEIPFTGIDFHCGRRRWDLFEIKEGLQDALRQELVRIRIKDTDYPPFEQPEEFYEQYRDLAWDDDGSIIGLPSEGLPEDAYDYFHYLLGFDMDAERYRDLTVGFQYDPEWGMDITGRPRNGRYLESQVERGQSFLRFLCLNPYHFTYDVQYPIKASIRDDSAFNGGGFIFSFAFPVLVDHNQPGREFLGRSFFDTPGSFIGTCTDMDDPGLPEFDIRARGIDDAGYNDDLRGAAITYSCGIYDCSLGQTDQDRFGINRLVTKLPRNCGNGIMIADKEGYLQAKQQIVTTDANPSPLLMLNLKKLKRLPFSVVKHEYNSVDPLAASRIRPEEDLAPNEKAIISIQSIENPQHLLFREFPVAQDPLAPEAELNPEFSSIDLIQEDGSYRVDIVLIDENAHDRVLGGYQNFTWNVQWSDIASADELVFNVIEYLPTPINDTQEWEILNFLQDDESYKTEIPPELR